MKLSELLADDTRLTNRLTVPILLNSDAAEACARAQKELADAQKALQRAEQRSAGMMREPELDEARERVETAEAELETANEKAAQHLVDFVVESVGSDEWERLVDAHPPSDEQRKQHGDQLWYDPSSFPEHAIAACLAEPEVDGLDDVRQLRSRVPDIVWQQLIAAVVRVNRGANAIPKSLTGSATTRSTPSR